MGFHKAFLLAALVVCVHGDENCAEGEDDCMETMGGLDGFHVKITNLEILESSEGIFDGDDDIKLELNCCSRFMSGGSASWSGSVEKSASPNLQVWCCDGADIKLDITEEDTFDDDKGSITITPSQYGPATSGMHMPIPVKLAGSDFWEMAADVFFQASGGNICVTDFIPSGKAAKAMKFSKRTQKKLKKLRKSVKALDMRMSMEDSCTDINDGCDALGLASAVWDKQCLEVSNPEGTYKITFEFSSCYALQASFLFAVSTLVATTLAMSSFLG